MTIQTTAWGHVIRVCFPDAADVRLVGRFNNWSNVATPLVHLGGWLWEARLPLEAELRDVCFFVWRQGERFGRLFHEDATPASTPQHGAAGGPRLLERSLP